MIEFKGFKEGQADQTEVYFKVECSECGTLIDFFRRETFPGVFCQAESHETDFGNHSILVKNGELQEFGESCGRFWDRAYRLTKI